MLIVSGGWGGERFQMSSEVMAHPSGSWREAEPLPSVRFGAMGASLAGIFHVLGGDYNGGGNYTDEIIAWDPVAETWSLAGHLATARRWHGVTELSLADVAGLCTASMKLQ
jgi:hypothetical protein